MTRLRAASATDVGRVRPINQDCVLVEEGLYAVADGMGGHAGGEVAARLAVEALQQAFTQRGPGDGLDGAVRQANRAVWERSSSDPQLRGMGTTITAVALVEDGDEEQLVVANVGDSRAYLLQNGEMTQLTTDHSLVAEMVSSGELTEDEAVGHPQRNIVTRVLGMAPDIEVDTWQLAPHAGDRLLLCSDGLVNEVADADIAGVLLEVPDPEEASTRLVAMARDHGGSDNISVVLVDVVEGPAALDGSAAAVAGAPTTGPPAKAPARKAPGKRAPARKTAGRKAPSRSGRGRRGLANTLRVGAFVVALCVVLGTAAGAMAWYARGSYFVGLSGNRLTVFQGRPGGLLWWRPTVARRTPVTTTDVLPSRLADLRAGKVEPSRQAALRYVNNLLAEAQAARAAGGAIAPAPPTIPKPTTTIATRTGTSSIP